MSLTVNLYYTGKSGSARRFAEEMESSGVADRIRQEPGNEKYDYFIPMNDPEAHHASPMMKELADLREKYDLHMHVERYVSDENGMPDTDQKFIRK